MKLWYGGGITSKSLSEIPNNINKMLRDNYKKIAIIKTNIKLTDGSGYRNTKIPLNLEFTPKYITVICQEDKSDNFDSIVYPFNKNQNTSSGGLMGCILDVTNKEFIINAVCINTYVKEIIAIG